MSLRAPEARDLDAVLEVIVARDVADFGAPDYTRADLEQQWREAGDGLALDACVAEHDGRVRGYAIVRGNDAQVIVHPRAVGHGLGGALLTWSEERERQLGRDSHRRDTASTDARGHALLAARDYAQVRSFMRMAVSLQGSFPRRPFPDGISSGRLDPVAHAEAIHALDQRAFAANAESVAQDLAAYRSRHLRGHDLDPALSVVAHAQGELVGFVLTHRWSEEDSGYVAILAVDPSRRREGLGRAMLSDAIARIAEAGLGIAQLSVASDNSRGLALYEDVGMHVRFQIDSFEKPAR